MTAEQPIIEPLVYTETCRICGKQFKGAPLASTTDPRMNKLGEALFKHMWDTDEVHKNFTITAIILAGFILEDPMAIQYGAPIRYMAFRALRKNFVPDEVLHDTVSRLTPEKFEDAMKDMRDFLTEEGEYAPKFAVQSA